MYNRLVMFAVVCCLVAPSWAETDTFEGIHPLQNSRLFARVGAFFADIDGSYAKFDSSGNPGTSIDYNELGLDDTQTLPIVELAWRLSDKFHVRAEYLTISEDTSDFIESDISWGDLDFSLGVDVSTDLDVDIVRAFFGYSVIKDQTKEISAGAGIHYASIDISLAGNASVNGTPIGNAEEALDEWGVMPNIGIQGNYVLSPKWLLLGRADWLSLTFDDYSGDLWHLEAGIQYQAFKHMGFALAYRYLDFELEEDDEWETDLEYTGPVLYLTVNY